MLSLLSLLFCLFFANVKSTPNGVPLTKTYLYQGSMLKRGADIKLMRYQSAYGAFAPSVRWIDRFKKCFAFSAIIIISQIIGDIH